jgi:nucleoside-diphosphate-sugar epimerase
MPTKGNDLKSAASVEFTHGDLTSPQSLDGFLEPGCVVVNLVYLWNASEAENLAIMSNISQACKAARINRLIHCSTAAVIGRARENNVSEETRCRPISPYGITKLKVEQVITSAATGYYDTAILRPTVVFGPNGNPLKKLVGDLANGSPLRNYLKSCLFGRRRMNLVPVSTVVAAIQFLINREEPFGGSVFNVSDDDSPANNFSDVESFLIGALGLPQYHVPRVPIPLDFLSFLLRCMGRNNVNPHCNYSPEKLLGLGFIRPISLEVALTEYTDWYRSVCSSVPELPSL